MEVWNDNKIDKVEKKEIRKDSNRIGIALIIYTLISFAVILTHMIGVCVYEIVTSIINELPEPEWEELESRLLESGTSSIVGVVLGTLFLALFFRKRIRFGELFDTVKKPNVMTMGQLLCIFLGGQFVFGIGGELLEKLLNVFGYSAMQSLETASSVSTTVSMFLYSSVVGPVIEEVVYRGYVLRSFQKYGKVTAIFVSAILFGVMHGNLPQGIFAFGVGLVLGYVAMEYSLGWAVFLHIINNCVYCDLLGMALSGLDEQMQNLIQTGLASGLQFWQLCLWKNRGHCKEF